MKKQLKMHNTILLILHVALLVFFFVTRAYFMAYINILSVTLYLLNFYLFEREHFRLAFHVMYFEIIFHSVVGIVVLGSSSGFAMLGMMVVPLVYYYDQISRSYDRIGINCKEYLLFDIGIVIFAEFTSFIVSPLYAVDTQVYHIVRIVIFGVIMSEFGVLMTQFVQSIRNAENRLQEQKSILERVSKQDALTGLHNRRSIMEFFQKAMASKTQFAVIMLDIDHFKNVNDTYGHECGDYVLVKVTNIILNCVRKCDVVSRWGGEEILIYLPGCDFSDVVIIAERIRNSVGSERFVYENYVFGVTVTQGVEVSDQHDSVESIIRVADDRLYRGKEGGRNRVVYR